MRWSPASRRSSPKTAGNCRCASAPLRPCRCRATPSARRTSWSCCRRAVGCWIRQPKPGSMHRSACASTRPVLLPVTVTVCASLAPSLAHVSRALCCHCLIHLLCAACASSQGALRARFFEALSWDKLMRRAYRPPVKPPIEHALDLQNFDREFTSAPVVDSLRERGSVGGGSSGSGGGVDWLEGFTFRGSAGPGGNGFASITSALREASRGPADGGGGGGGRPDPPPPSGPPTIGPPPPRPPQIGPPPPPRSSRAV
jgi:hypothetical protein